MTGGRETQIRTISLYSIDDGFLAATNDLAIALGNICPSTLRSLVLCTLWIMAVFAYLPELN